MSTLFLDRKTVKKLINMTDVLNVVEEAFRMWGERKGSMPTKAYLHVERGDFRAMPAALPGCAGLKWVNVHPQNRSHNLPSVMGVIVYNDPETGYPLSVMDATEITAYRTGAAAGIASKYLARKDSNTLGIIGAGRQAYTQILAHSELFNFNSINVFDISDAAVAILKRSLPKLPIRNCFIEEAVRSDIVCTLTPSRQPFIKREWIFEGSHINAVGADAPGKEELDPIVLKEAIVVVDDIRQANSGGEINVPIQRGIYNIDEIYGTLDELVTGKKKGRMDDKAITIFDSTGIAIEDITVARLIFAKAQREGLGKPIDLIGE